MSERTHLLNQRKPIFEGPTTAYWTTGASQSLPPPATPKVKQQCTSSDAVPATRLSEAEIKEIHRLRHAAGLSQSEICNAVGRSRETVRRALGVLSVVPQAAPAPMPQREPVPARAHYVLDWQARMSKWIFEDNYQRPRSRRRLKVLVHERHAIGQRWLGTATEINSRPRASKDPPFK